MPLGEPPAADVLAGLPVRSVADLELHRVRRAEHGPWWFSSIDPAQPEESGRFDLATPHGSCYLATSAIAAVLEHFQGFSQGVVSQDALRERRRAQLLAPPSAPNAADLAEPGALAVGVTLALSGSNGQLRWLTQLWAHALHASGWAALHHPVQHDPSGAKRGVTLFDTAGPHPPYGDADGWAHSDHELHDDPDIVAALDQFGIKVTPVPDLPVIDLEASGLLNDA